MAEPTVSWSTTDVSHGERKCPFISTAKSANKTVSSMRLPVKRLGSQQLGLGLGFLPNRTFTIEILPI
jgi:hypothetical protein